ncbi:MAG: DegT/DnrJ/EryC1/StrS family aminotransferase [Myxococcota bacterium]|nr:DegT/DnrJ/EryC1/StrS family aminotransferase [Myxococcota bacterium]
MQIPIAKPWFDENECEAIQKPLQTGWVVQGPEVEKFETSVCEFTNAAGAAACTSATTGLHLALNALCIGKGDEVIVPSFSFVASANSVLYNRAKPVLVDIDLDTFNVTAESIYSAISDKTKAIMPVHLFGQAAPMAQIMEIAQQHNLAVIEDTACALGTMYKNQHVGTFGEFGVFSFHPRKVISTGEGGMLITRNAGYMDSIRSLRSHGISPKQKSGDSETPSFLLGDFDRLGYNYRMTDMQGALGRVQMQKLPKILARKRQLAKRYDHRLRSMGWLRIPKVETGGEHSYQAYVCLFAPKEPNQSNWEELYRQRNTLMNKLAEKGIATRQGTQAIHGLSLYGNEFGYQPMDLPNAWLAEKLSIALPLYPQMTDAEQDYVIDMLREAGASVS